MTRRLSASLLAATLLLAGCSRVSGARRDDLGRPVEVARTARLVTLAPNLTEIVCAIGACDRIAGTDEASNYPPAAAAKPKVGGVRPSVERIARLRPDLVLASASAFHPSLDSGLASAGIPLYVARTDRLADVGRVMESLGALLNAPGAKAAAERVRTGLAAQRRTRATAPRVLFLVWTEPLYVAGRETFVDDLLSLTGCRNASGPAVTGWPQYSMEALLASPPDVILYPSKSISRERLEAAFRSDSRWMELEAVRRGFYDPVDEDVFTRPGPRVAEAAAELNRVIDEWERRR